ncbi:MAG: hypothetical protein IPH13_00605 [Planctomycetes bacterium]|nr:hypothetical protein [Planctomycetota bacterium]
MPMRSAWLCAFLLVVSGCSAPVESSSAALRVEHKLLATLTAILDFRAPTSPSSPSDPVYVTITIPPPWFGSSELQIGNVRVNYLRVQTFRIYGSDLPTVAGPYNVFASGDSLPVAVLDGTFKRAATGSTHYEVQVEVRGHDSTYSSKTLKFTGSVEVPNQAFLAKINLHEVPGESPGQ